MNYFKRTIVSLSVEKIRVRMKQILGVSLSLRTLKNVLYNGLQNFVSIVFARILRQDYIYNIVSTKAFEFYGQDYVQ